MKPKKRRSLGTSQLWRVKNESKLLANPTGGPIDMNDSNLFIHNNYGALMKFTIYS